jgi:hypothetical protein
MMWTTENRSCPHHPQPLRLLLRRQPLALMFYLQLNITPIYIELAAQAN